MSNTWQQWAALCNSRQLCSTEGMQLCVTKAAASEQQQATLHVNNGRQLCVTAGYSEQQQATVNSSTYTTKSNSRQQWAALCSIVQLSNRIKVTVKQRWATADIVNSEEQLVGNCNCEQQQETVSNCAWAAVNNSKQQAESNSRKQ